MISYASRKDSSTHSCLVSFLLLGFTSVVFGLSFDDIASIPLYTKDIRAKGFVSEKNNQMAVCSSSAAYRQGVQAIQAGNLIKGIILLDSLRLAGFDDQAFLAEYAAATYNALVPEKSDTQLQLLRNFSPLVPDTIKPSFKQWQVIRMGSPNQRNLPNFAYTATFDIRKSFHLIFNGVNAPRLPDMTLGPGHDNRSLNALRYQRATRKDSLVCRLFIDLNSSKTPIMEYLSKRIDGVYDSISVKHDLGAVRGVSLRCYTGNRYVRDDATVTAIASFDRPLYEKSAGNAPHTASHRSGSIRYVLVVQSPADAEEATEAKFQHILLALL